MCAPPSGSPKPLETRAETLGERFGDPGGPDPGEAPSSGVRASGMRKRAAQGLNPEMGRMGAEAPPTAFRLSLLVQRPPNDPVERL
jgi:hypothetical protein